MSKDKDFFNNYALPPYLKSSSLLGADVEGLPDDFVFSQGMKVIMLVACVVAYMTRFRFAFAPDAKTLKVG